MFYLGWIVLTLTGISVSIAAFLWALRTGQFLDQGRARYLPLRDELPMPKGASPSRLPVEVYVLLFAFGLGLLALIWTVALTLLRVRG